ncbi:Rab32B2 [Monocercomonoides exilis]|uniref:Rab32B2 n=1 Tax=Monocercomonoides exilis TaxID=2049356 RepID=UPI00355A47CE|nr:Rab32B2 [Monocercomonoides exilis]|eukprot:MONOS_6696.1-p1 / transcript=MONOS_6696.1 / gene=MONOS_6696 / organism=Monocercomonoides_exilis_PA203 / gene_product=Rab32B2 / transcript_product=Rab32B2 / location=Mono_scaffold00216:475-1797(-) / protein_length=244 / sequence_SO=supercontig / SO=protein_coding / is_pseudo=false
MSKRTQYLFKVLVVGDYAVGKTSLIKRYVSNVFNTNYKLTIGVDYCEKSIDWGDGVTISLQLWDIAGHERFGHMTSVYYKHAIASLIVFDLARPETLETSLKWKEDINSRISLADGRSIPFMLLANKCDLPEVSIDREYLNRFVEENGFVGWMETSARTNKNIDSAVRMLVRSILSLTGIDAKGAGGGGTEEGDALRGDDEDEEEHVHPAYTTLEDEERSRPKMKKVDTSKSTEEDGKSKCSC